MRKMLIYIVAALFLMTAAPAAMAAEYTDEGVEIIDIRMIPQPTPTPPPARPVETKSFEHDRDDLETLARLLWSSPLRDEEQKRTLLWVVFNRVDDESDAFGDTIQEVVTKHEFTWYDDDAHLSDKNLQIAQNCMDEWVSEDHGFYVGRHVPKCGLYIRFVGENKRQVEALKTPDDEAEALRW